MVAKACSSLQPILRISSSESADTNFSSEIEHLFLSLRKNLQQENDDGDDINQAIDSDEETKLFEELDALMEAQERADAFKGNVHQLMAQTFQKVSRRVVELETAYDLVLIFIFASHFP